MNISGILFDMDGVLIDSHSTHRVARRSFLEGVGRTTSETELDIILDGGKRERYSNTF